MPPRKVPQGTKWKPGQSGNPGGRPKGVGKRARELAGDDPGTLLMILLEVAKDETAKPSDRVAAAREYLDRGWGKAPVFAPMEDGDPLELSDVDREIAAIVDELAARRQDPSANGAATPPLAGSNGSTRAASA